MLQIRQTSQESATNPRQMFCRQVPTKDQAHNSTDQRYSTQPVDLLGLMLMGFFIEERNKHKCNKPSGRLI